MGCRRHATGPGIMLWLLIAVADLVLLVTTVGVWTVLATAFGTALAAGAAVLLWLLWQRRTAVSHRAAHAADRALAPARSRRVTASGA
jgi:uncharacterized membrane protein YccC